MLETPAELFQLNPEAFAFDIKQTRDYWADKKRCAKGLFALANGICFNSCDMFSRIKSKMIKLKFYFTVKPTYIGHFKATLKLSDHFQRNLLLLSAVLAHE